MLLVAFVICWVSFNSMLMVHCPFCCQEAFFGCNRVLHQDMAFSMNEVSQELDGAPQTFIFFLGRLQEHVVIAVERQFDVKEARAMWWPTIV